MKKLVLFLVLSIYLFAEVGQIVALKGVVIIIRNGKEIKATVGTKIEKKDIVFSKQNSKTQIIFNDKTVITIGKNSKFKIEEYFYNAKSNTKSKARFKFFRGAFRSITGKIGKIAPSRFKLRTKSASIGIRGTQILAQIGNTEKIACTDGKIEVTTPKGSVVVTAGQITEVSPNTPPSPPRAYKSTEIKAIAKASGGGKPKEDPNKIIIKEDKKEGKETAKKEENKKKKDKKEQKKEKSKKDKNKKESKQKEQKKSKKQKESKQKEQKSKKQNKNKENKKQLSKKNEQKKPIKKEKTKKEQEKVAKKSEKKQAKEQKQEIKKATSTKKQSTTKAKVAKTKIKQTQSQNNQNSQQNDNKQVKSKESQIENKQQSEQNQQSTQKNEEQQQTQTNNTEDKQQTTQQEEQTTQTNQASANDEQTQTQGTQTEQSNEQLSQTNTNDEQSQAEQSQETQSEQVVVQEQPQKAQTEQPTIQDQSQDTGLEQSQLETNTEQPEQSATNTDVLNSKNVDNLASVNEETGADTLLHDSTNVVDSTATDEELSTAMPSQDSTDITDSTSASIPEDSDNIGDNVANVGNSIDEVNENVDDIKDDATEDKKNEEVEVVTNPIVPMQELNGFDINDNIDLINFVGELGENHTENYNDPYVSWGEWYNGDNSDDIQNIVGFYVGGEITPSEVIDSYVEKHAVYTYSGDVDGIVLSDTAKYRIENGSFNFTINYNSENPISGNIGFDANDKHWCLKVDKSVLNNQAFGGTLTTAGSSDIQIDSGKFAGRHYGDNAQFIGGGFETISGDLKAKGIFIGNKK